MTGQHLDQAGQHLDQALDLDQAEDLVEFVSAVL